MFFMKEAWVQAQANLNAKDEDLQQLQATLTAKDIEVQQLHNGIDNLQAQLALQTRSIQQPKAHHQQVVKKDRVIHHLTATVEQLQDETAKADSKLEQLHHDILLKDRALVDSNTQLQQLQNDFRKDEAAADRDMQLQELKSDLLQRDNSLADRNWEVQQLKIALLRKEEAHKFTKESSHKEMQLLRFNFQSKRKALADRDMQMQQLHDELCQTDSILADTEVEVHELKHDHSWTEKSLSDLQLAYNDKSNLVAQKDDIIQQLLTERHYNLANQAQLSESRASIAKLEVEKDEQIAHLIRANDTAEDLARDHMQLGQHYSELVQRHGVQASQLIRLRAALEDMTQGCANLVHHVTDSEWLAARQKQAFKSAQLVLKMRVANLEQTLVSLLIANRDLQFKQKTAEDELVQSNTIRTRLMRSAVALAFPGFFYCQSFFV